MRYRFALLSAALLVFTCSAAQKQSDRNTGQTRSVYEAAEFKGMPYRLMKPANYDKTKSYSLILSLHGAGGVGTDNEKNLRKWNRDVMATKDWRTKYPCFVLVPQCTGQWVRPRTVKDDIIAAGGDEFVSSLSERMQRMVKRILKLPDYYGLEIVFDLIDKIQKDFNIDEKRIYVLGASMGGFGSWTAMQEEPDLFAAGIPVCGGPSPTQNLDLDRIKHIPIWAFHGKEDSTIPYEKSKNAFEKLKIAKGNCKLTSLSGVGHGSWNQAFEYKGDDKTKGYVTEYSSNKCDKESDVWEWLFRQHK